MFESSRSKNVKTLVNRDVNYFWCVEPQSGPVSVRSRGVPASTSENPTRLPSSNDGGREEVKAGEDDGQSGGGGSTSDADDSLSLLIEWRVGYFIYVIRIKLNNILLCAAKNRNIAYCLVLVA